MAPEALALHIEGMIEDGETIPSVSSLDAVMADAGNRDVVAFLVDAAASPTKAVRFDITLPEDLVTAIERLTNNRSRFLAEAAARAKLRDVA